MNENIKVGIDVGSTTVKIVILDEKNNFLYGDYQRHKADIRNTVIQVVNQAFDSVSNKLENKEKTKLSVKVTGSGGFAVSQWLEIPFIQEVIAATTCVKQTIPQTDVVIELGGEDAKITYFKGGTEQRMNGTCAGGTGAFIDQMAALLETDANGLNELAKDATTIYPIAARCGVFAKTDIQPLINEGAARSDIAASIFQAVVSQTISGLACGKPIRGNVAFLGGPLHFMDQLRHRFIVTLNLKPEEIIVPQNSQLFVAHGAALSADFSSCVQECELMDIQEFTARLNNLKGATLKEVQRLEPLFKNTEELNEFTERHGKQTAKRGDLASTVGPVFLGLDAGSTTTKAVLINQQGELLWHFYDVNAGNPVNLAVKVLKDLYSKLPQNCYIARSVSTGYGESLFKAAFGVDDGEVETITHYRAAEFFVPGVEFLLDIGGQDMKCLRMKDGAITSIQLNEACSAGCGSFLDNFARTMGMSVQEFSKLALLAENPIDLGTRCTVFMNSRVKQAQKEGAEVSDISAGLSYSVIKNALFKVIKLRNVNEIGSKIVVQGGTFNNDAVLRAFEKITGTQVYRSDMAGLMGAYGSALIALDQWNHLKLTNDNKVEKSDYSKENLRSNIATLQDLENFSVKLDLHRCGKCSNNCLLTVNTFVSGNNERTFITGNRCEKGLETQEGTPTVSQIQEKLPNIFDWKYKRLFSYIPLKKEEAKFGEVGIPRVLNIYENYPLWFTFFTELGFRVRISGRSSHTIYEKGMESIPSESVCYPGKISHGHIENLLQQGINFIFYPCIPYEKQEDSTAGNHYNCPIVTSYSETLRNNIDTLRQDKNVLFMNPFLPLYDKKRLAERLYQELSKHFDVSQKEVVSALEKAWNEQEKFKKEVQQKGEEVLEEIILKGKRGIVLAGRPYHLDPEINHGIPEMINSLGLAVLTEDSICHLGVVERPLRVIDQWTYHNRLYRAANFVSEMPNLELVQLTSFGCGLDAVTADQVDEICKSKSKMYTLIKIDEGSNLGAVRIRIRSLIAAVKEREKNQKKTVKTTSSYKRQIFTKEMKVKHTILAPMLSPIHFKLLEAVFRYAGYNFVVLDAVDPKAVESGLKYVNNDACYPSIIVAGQMIAALQSGKYDLDNTSLLITQTGGGCRATNYIGFIRRALADAGLSKVPVISVSTQGFEKNPGFKLDGITLLRAGRCFVLGDLLMQCLLRTRPYEKVPGSANALYEKWMKKCLKGLKINTIFAYHHLIRGIIRDFDNLEITDVRKPRVGVVGEILVKFHPTANNQIVETLEAEGAEAVVPNLYDFGLYTLATGIFRHKELAFDRKTEKNARFYVWVLELFRRYETVRLKLSKRFSPPTSIYKMMKSVNDIVQVGNIMGEGWFLTAEMVELIEHDVPSIVCVQPFACLPNHITGKGMIKELKRRYPSSNISAIDYDPGSSEVNQLNRLKLLLSNAPIGLNPDEKHYEKH